MWRCDPTRVMASSFLRFLDHTQRRTTIGRTPLDERSARHRDLYLTTHNTHNRQTSMPPVGFEPTISAGERPQTYALDGAATTTGIYIYIYSEKIFSTHSFGGEVKPSVPCRRFVACKRSLELRGSRILRRNLSEHFSPTKSSTFRC